MVVNTTGNEKTRLSVAFCASANGDKLAPVILIPRKRPLKNYNPPNNVILVYDKEANFNAKVLENNFFDRLLKPHMLTNRLSKASLLIDSAPCHMKKSLIQKAKEAKVNIEYIPAGMTSFLQPADVMWIGVLKRKFHAKWENWYLNEPKSITKFGNIKSPGYANVNFF